MIRHQVTAALLEDHTPGPTPGPVKLTIPPTVALTYGQLEKKPDDIILCLATRQVAGDPMPMICARPAHTHPDDTEHATARNGGHGDVAQYTWQDDE